MSLRFLVASLLVATTARAQSVASGSNDPAIGGIVRDSSGTPIADAEVAVMRGNRLQQFMITGPDGKFSLTGLPPAVVPLRIRRVGYALQAFDVDPRLAASKSLEIVLGSVPSQLEEVTVEGESGRLKEFYKHREERGGFARFFEQSDIQRMGVTNSSEMFRNIPGVVLRTASGGNALRIRDCQPMVFLDGQRVPGAELDELIHPSDIAAIEFYPSNAGVPPQYAERTNRLCGSILVWTRTR